MQLDSRIAHMFTQATASDKFIATALLLLCDKAKISETLFTALRKENLNPLEVVGGKQLFLTKNKSEESLRKEGMTEKQIGEIKKHLKLYNLSLPGDEPQSPKADVVVSEDDDDAEDLDLDPGASIGLKDANPDEPAFAGKTLTELAGKTDAELLKIEGISPAAIIEIRKAEAAKTSAPVT